jgi:hypothetical protein
MDDNETKKEETNEEQIERAYKAILYALPEDMCYFNVMSGLVRVLGDYLQAGHEEEHGENDDDDDDEPPYGHITGTNFSKN